MSKTDYDAPKTLAEALDAMAGGVRALHAREDTGALAALRRLDVDRPTTPAFHALLAPSVPDHLFAAAGELDAMTRRFARVAQIMALKPDGLDRKKQLGKVLFAIHALERPLAMLLNAQGPTLDDLIRRTARRIALSDEPLPYRDLCLLILYSGRRRDAAKLDELRLKIARDFQRAARDSSKHPDTAENREAS